MLKTEKKYWLTIAGSLLVGVVTGVVISLYRFFVENTADCMNRFYAVATAHWLWVPLLFGLLILGGLLCGFIVSKDKFIAGSGVPQTQLEIKNNNERNWLKLILLKISGGILCLGAGLSLGREGPSVQLGALAAGWLQRKFKANMDFNLVFGCGAGAGLAAALNAPLAGTMFAIEELYKKLSPLTLICVLLSSIASTMVVEKVFGIAPLLKFNEFPVPEMSLYPVFVLIGVLAGIAGALFCGSCLWLQDRAAGIGWKTKFVLIFVVTGIVGMLAPDLLGVREGFLIKYIHLLPILQVLVLLFLLKWLFTVLSIASSAPGGIFVPLIGIGLLLGMVVAKVLGILGINVSADMIVALVMGGYFVAVIRAPLTAIVLVAEVTNSFVCFLPLAVVCVTAMLAADLLGAEPIYESMIERMEKPLEKSAGIQQ